MLRTKSMMPPIHMKNDIKPNNSYPIVLVHGFQGWGRNEMFGHKYWGGFTDIEAELTKRSYKTMTAVVGPYSSNWDRACELYAYIKGGTVDYGEQHSKKHNHARYGKTYPGIFPEWSEEKKIHIFAHSMGGQTARLLIHLLEHGYPAEQGEGCSSLFEGGKKWIFSLSTLSTPHNGTTLTRMINSTIPFAKEIIATVASLKGVGAAPEWVYDLKLEQWGLKREKDESSVKYFTRVAESSIWKENKDICLHDLSPQGAADFNSWVKTSENVYYFSWATNCSRPSLISDKHIPRFGLKPLWIPSSIFMGAHTGVKKDDTINVDEDWWPNDGVVNTVSMRGPILDSDDTIIERSTNFKQGEWNYRGVLSSTDHIDALGIMKPPKSCTIKGCSTLLDWYIKRAQELQSLELQVEKLQQI